MTYLAEKINWLDIAAAWNPREASVIVALPTADDCSRERARVLGLHPSSGLGATLNCALLGAEVIRVDDPKGGNPVRFSTAFRTWLQVGGPLL